jgi:hypothetical protein
VSGTSLLIYWPTVAMLIGLVAVAGRLDLIWRSARGATRVEHVRARRAAALAANGQFVAALALGIVATEALRANLGLPELEVVSSVADALAALAVLLLAVGGHRALPPRTWARRTALLAAAAATVALGASLVGLGIARFAALGVERAVNLAGISLAVALLSRSIATTWKSSLGRAIAIGPAVCGADSAALQVLAMTATGELVRVAAGLSTQFLIAAVALFVAGAASELGWSATRVSGVAWAAITASGLVALLIGYALAVGRVAAAPFLIASGATVSIMVCVCLFVAHRKEATGP